MSFLKNGTWNKLDFLKQLFGILKPISDSNFGEPIKPFNKSNNMISGTFILKSQLEKSKWEIHKLFEIGVFNL